MSRIPLTEAHDFIYRQRDEEGVKTVPDIIKAAAVSPLGIFALMIICLSVLGFAFFNKAHQYVKLVIFLCLFGGVVAFGFS